MWVWILAGNNRQMYSDVLIYNEEDKNSKTSLSATETLCRPSGHSSWSWGCGGGSWLRNPRWGGYVQGNDMLYYGMWYPYVNLWVDNSELCSLTTWSSHSARVFSPKVSRDITPWYHIWWRPGYEPAEKKSYAKKRKADEDPKKPVSEADLDDLVKNEKVTSRQSGRSDTCQLDRYLVSELKEMLQKHEIPFKSSAKKADLISILTEFSRTGEKVILVWFSASLSSNHIPNADFILLAAIYNRWWWMTAWGGWTRQEEVQEERWWRTKETGKEVRRAKGQESRSKTQTSAGEFQWIFSTC